MGKLVNRARMTVTSTGTGTLTLGGATFGCQTFASAGVVNGDVVSYTIEDGANWECGTGTYTSSGTTLSRTVTQSYNGTTYGTSPISVTTNAQVFITALAADLTSAANITSGTLGVANGGTGLSSLTAGYIPYASSTSALSFSSPLYTDGVNVTIGNAPTTAGVPFSVLANASSNCIRLVGRSSDNVSTLDFVSNNSASGYAYLQAASSYLSFGTNSSERMRIDSSGKVLIGTSTAGASKLTVDDDSIQINTAKTPASATATGTTGQVCWDASYIYVCTATNTWKRAAIATW